MALRIRQAQMDAFRQALWLPFIERQMARLRMSSALEIRDWDETALRDWITARICDVEAMQLVSEEDADLLLDLLLLTPDKRMLTAWLRDFNSQPGIPIEIRLESLRDRIFFPDEELAE